MHTKRFYKQISLIILKSTKKTNRNERKKKKIEKKERMEKQLTPLQIDALYIYLLSTD